MKDMRAMIRAIVLMLLLFVCMELAGCGSNRDIGNDTSRSDEAADLGQRDDELSGREQSVTSDEKQALGSDRKRAVGFDGNRSGNSDGKRAGGSAGNSLYKLEKEMGTEGWYSFLDLRTAVGMNSSIGEEYKGYFYLFIDGMEEKFPNLPLTVFYKNLTSLQIEVVDKEEMEKRKGAGSLAGFYSSGENTLLLNRDRDRASAEYVIYHEIGHMVTNYHDTDGFSYDFAAEKEEVILEEAINCMFTEAVMDLSISGMSYQTAVNHTEILLEASGYELGEVLGLTAADLLAASMPALEAEGITREAYLESMQKQREAVHRITEEGLADDRVSADAWRGIAGIFFRMHVTEGMKKKELLECYDTFVRQMTRDVYTSGEEYVMDLQPAAEVFFHVLEEMQIDSGELPEAKEILLSYPVSVR